MMQSPSTGPVIGIVVSTELEANVLLGSLAGREEISVQHKPFYSGTLKGNVRAAICICGVGKANAAHGTTLLLERFGPGLVYSIGVAGAYPSSGLKAGDIAVAEREIYGDEGLALRGTFLTMDAIGFPLCSYGGSDYYNEFPLSVPGHLKDFTAQGRFLTVSSCTGALEKGRKLEKKFGAICENMEGAAVAHICTLNGVPAAEIRGVSNVIEDRAEGPLKRADIIEAAENVQRFFLERLL